MKELDTVIGEHPFFEGLSAADLDLIAGCGQIAVFRPGQFLLRAGTPADHFFLIRRGKLSLEMTAPGKDPFVFETLSDGDVVGWSWLFEPNVAQFDARSIDDTRVVQFDGKCLRGKCDADPRLGFDLMKRFARKLIQRFADTRLQLLDVYGKRD